MSRVGQTYFVIAVWRAKEQKSALREVLGANRRQSQQGRLDVGLRFNRGFQRRTIFIADAHRGDGNHFVVRADEKLTAFVELECAIGRL